MGHSLRRIPFQSIAVPQTIAKKSDRKDRTLQVTEWGPKRPGSFAVSRNGYATRRRTAGSPARKWISRNEGSGTLIGAHPSSRYGADRKRQHSGGKIESEHLECPSELGDGRGQSRPGGAQLRRDVGSNRGIGEGVELHLEFSEMISDMATAVENLDEVIHHLDSALAITVDNVVRLPLRAQPYQRAQLTNVDARREVIDEELRRRPVSSLHLPFIAVVSVVDPLGRPLQRPGAGLAVHAPVAKTELLPVQSTTRRVEVAHVEEATAAIPYCPPDGRPQCREGKAESGAEGDLPLAAIGVHLHTPLPTR